MTPSETTCWTMIKAAAKGDMTEREQFARHYLGPVRAYLLSRWRDSFCRAWVDDAVQEVFVECFRSDGPLANADRKRHFRPFLYSVVRNVARRMEERFVPERRKSAKGDVNLDALPADEESLSHIFDRALAKTIMQQAAERQKELAEKAGEAACRRFELLQLRFQNEMPIREIALRWNVDAEHLHREYKKARNEFKAALAQVVAFHHPGSPAEVDRECANLLALLE